MILLQVRGRGSEPGAEHEAVQDLGEGWPQRERGVPTSGRELRQQGQWSRSRLLGVTPDVPSSVFRQSLIGTFPRVPFAAQALCSVEVGVPMPGFVKDNYKIEVTL